jgi:hypothetical protein
MGRADQVHPPALCTYGRSRMSVRSRMDPSLAMSPCDFTALAGNFHERMLMVRWAIPMWALYLNQPKLSSLSIPDDEIWTAASKVCLLIDCVESPGHEIWQTPANGLGLPLGSPTEPGYAGLPPPRVHPDPFFMWPE